MREYESFKVRVEHKASTAIITIEMTTAHDKQGELMLLANEARELASKLLEAADTYAAIRSAQDAN